MTPVWHLPVLILMTLWIIVFSAQRLRWMYPSDSISTGRRARRTPGRHSKPGHGWQTQRSISQMAMTSPWGLTAHGSMTLLPWLDATLTQASPSPSAYGRLMMVESQFQSMRWMAQYAQQKSDGTSAP